MAQIEKENVPVIDLGFKEQKGRNYGVWGWLTKVL